MDSNDERRTSPDLAAIDKARRDVAKLEARTEAVAAELRQSIAQRERLRRTGGDAREIQRLDRSIADLKTERDLVRDSLRKASETLLELRGGLVGSRGPDDLVATLAGSHPVTMMPVRLETRFGKQGTELRIRIFPDQIHVDQHDPALTSDERAAGSWYWDERRQGGVDPARAQNAWQELVRRFEPPRAAWIVEATQPGATPATRSSAAAKPSVAVALPDRWLAVGYRNGKEQFRKWSSKAVPDRLAVGLAADVTETDPAAAPAPTEELPLPEDMKWMVDYAAAETQGMAITVTQADVVANGPTLATGVDRLVVIGVDWTLTPDQAASSIERLLEAHFYGDGLSVVPQGTPTNNTAPSAAGADNTTTAALDPLAGDPASGSTPTSVALARFLGVHDSNVLRRIPGGGCREQETAQRLLSAIWSSTMGAYLMRMLDPLVDAATEAATREHAVRYVRPNGVAPTLRVGKQPYGILPILPGGFAGGPFETELASLLQKVRQPWSRVLGAVPRVAAGPGPDAASGTLESRMASMLQQAPVAASLRFRRILSQTTAANSSLPSDVADVQERLMLLLLSHFGWKRRPFISGLTAEPTQYPLPVPFVQATEPGAGPLTPNYIAEIAALLQTGPARASLARRLADLQDGDTLLQSFLALAAVQAIDAGTLATLEPLVPAEQRKKGSLASGHFPVDETVHVKKGPASGIDAIVSTPGDAAEVVLPQIDQNRPVSELIGLALRDAQIRRRLPDAAVRPVETLLHDLQYLAGRSAKEIDWAFRGVLDCFSYRLDAWITSLAQRRLRELRGRPGGATGTHIGAYGWVENLRPDPDSSASLGHVLAPSLPHAAAAAILRSGFEAHADAGQSPLDIELTSARVSDALNVLDGVARGQPLAALLGYRLERALQTRDPRLARFILPIRIVAPLKPSPAGIPAATGPSETVAARDVADGVVLVDRLRAERAQLLLDIKTAATRSPQHAQAVASLMPLVERELNALSALMDSISDVLVAEAAYQTVMGNHERAAAALGVLDRQARPPQPQIVETPRSGQVYTQRTAVVTLESLPAPQGVTINDPVLRAWAPYSTDERAAAEPRMNAWIARLLGPPNRYRFAADLVTKQEGAPEVREALDPISLEALRLSPLMLLASAKSGSQSGPSELHRRIVAAFLRGRPALRADTAIELKRAPASGVGDAVGLGALEGILALIQDLVGRVRALDNRDFASPASEPATAIVTGDVSARSIKLVERIRSTAVPLAAALAIDPVDPDALFDALMSLSNAGIMGAMPAVLDSAGLTPQSEALLRLLDRAKDTKASLDGALGRIDVLDRDWAARADKPTSAEVEYHTERIRELLGKDFPVIAPFVIADASQLAASLGDRAALTRDDPFAVTSWLQRLALVRPALDRLAAVFSAADLLGTLPADLGLRVAQLAHSPGQRWLALPQKGPRPSADLALVLHSVVPLTVSPSDQILAGFFVDDWTETIPSAEETIAAAFHYDAPAARAPQAILLATPPTLALPNWTSDLLLDTVNEALELAQLRMIGPEQLDFHGLLLPAIYLPDGFTRDVPGVNLGKFKDLVLRNLAGAALGKQSVWTSR